MHYSTYTLWHKIIFRIEFDTYTSSFLQAYLTNNIFKLLFFSKHIFFSYFEILFLKVSPLFIVSDIMTTALYPLVHDVMQRNIMCVWFWVLTVLKNCASIWSSELKRLFCATLNNAVWSALYVNCTFSLIRFFNVEFWVSILYLRTM